MSLLNKDAVSLNSSVFEVENLPILHGGIILNDVTKVMNSMLEMAWSKIVIEGTEIVWEAVLAILLVLSTSDPDPQSW